MTFQFLKWLLSIQVPSWIQFSGTARNSRAHMCPDHTGPSLWLPTACRSPRIFFNPVLLSNTIHLLSILKKSNSLQLLQITFFLGTPNFFSCLSIHHDLVCLPRSCLGLGDLSSPRSSLQGTSHPFQGFERSVSSRKWQDARNKDWAISFTSYSPAQGCLGESVCTREGFQDVWL